MRIYFVYGCLFSPYISICIFGLLYLDYDIYAKPICDLSLLGLGYVSLLFRSVRSCLGQVCELPGIIYCALLILLNYTPTTLAGILTKLVFRVIALAPFHSFHDGILITRSMFLSYGRQLPGRLRTFLQCVHDSIYDLREIGSFCSWRFVNVWK